VGCVKSSIAEAIALTQPSVGHLAVGSSTPWWVAVASIRQFSFGARFALYRAAGLLWRGPSECCHGRPESGFPHFLFRRSMPSHGPSSVLRAVYNGHDVWFCSFSLTTQIPRPFTILVAFASSTPQPPYQCRNLSTALARSTVILPIFPSCEN